MDLSPTKEEDQTFGFKVWFQPWKWELQFGSTGQGGPSKNENDDKFDDVKVFTTKMVRCNSLEKIAKVDAEVDKLQNQEEQP